MYNSCEGTPVLPSRLRAALNPKRWRLASTFVEDTWQRLSLQNGERLAGGFGSSLLLVFSVLRLLYTPYTDLLAWNSLSTANVKLNLLGDECQEMRASKGA